MNKQNTKKLSDEHWHELLNNATRVNKKLGELLDEQNTEKLSDEQLRELLANATKVNEELEKLENVVKGKHNENAT